MKKRPYFYLCIILLGVLFCCLVFGNDTTTNRIDHEISEFDATVSGGNLIPDGNIDYEVSKEYEGNKLSALNASISNKITGLFQKFFNFIKKIIKKIVS